MNSFSSKIFPILAFLFASWSYEYPETLKPYGNLIVPILCLIMLGMGATLSVSDFVAALRKPKAVALGMFLQFAIMPLAAFLIARFFGMNTEQTTGMILVGAVSGGTASNVITCIAGGNVALSITMTACSTVAGVVLTPLLTQFYIGQTVNVPVGEMFESILTIVAVPVGLGLVINRIFGSRNELLKRICPIFSMVGIVAVIGVIISQNTEQIRSAGTLILCAVALHNACGLTFGYIGAKLFGFDRKTCITIAIETGMQNSGLAAALAKQCFSLGAALPAAVFSVWHNISGSIFAWIVREKFDARKSIK